MDDDKPTPVWPKLRMLSAFAALFVVPLAIGIAWQGRQRSTPSPAPSPPDSPAGEPLSTFDRAIAPQTNPLRAGEPVKEPWKATLNPETGFQKQSAPVTSDAAQGRQLAAAPPPPHEKAGVNLVVKFEGSGPPKDGKLHPYIDGMGVEIIGYGHAITVEEQQTGLISIAGEPVPYAQGITEAQAAALLQQDLKPIRHDIETLVTVKLTKNQLEALTSFTYNVGLGTFKDSTLLKKLNAGQHNEVPTEMRRFTIADSQQQPGLVTRREAEIELWHKPDALAQQ
ncbi:MAG: lysozyme [Tildeniella torsiva UHER 1998/13D]|nr:lysozyme [Tildeniella torsiva UHER 1998/13D]